LCVVQILSLTSWTLICFFAHIFAAYYLFIFFYAAKGHEPSLRGKATGGIFAMVHVIWETIVFFFLSVLIAFGTFCPYEQRRHFSEFNLPTPPLSHVLQVYSMWLVPADFILSLVLLIMIFEAFDNPNLFFANGINRLRFTGLIVATDLLFNFSLVWLQLTFKQNSL